MAKPLRKDRFSTQQTRETLSEQNQRNQDSTDLQIDRARAMKIAGEGNPRTLQREIEKLDAEAEEEVDALRVNLLQDDGADTTRDGTGRVVDELAEQKVETFTEVGPLAGERGAVSVTPGRDDTSKTLRRHDPRTESVVESNPDEPRSESAIKRKVDGCAAA